MEKCKKCNSKEIEIDKNYYYHDIYECNKCGFWNFQRIDECCRNPFKIVVIDRKNDNLYFIREQYKHCGGSINKDKPLNKKEYSDLICDELNVYRDNEYKNKVENERQFLSELKGKYLKYNSKYAKYYRYLQSDEWKSKRHKVLKRDSSICQICKINPADEVHHKTYDNIFNEKLDDLISICKSCHKEIHFPDL